MWMTVVIETGAENGLQRWETLRRTLVLGSESDLRWHQPKTKQPENPRRGLMNCGARCGTLDGAGRCPRANSEFDDRTWLVINI
jgi:hypothetical protein